MATSLNLANEHINHLKQENEQLKCECKDLEFQIHQKEVAEQDRRIQALKDQKDKELSSHQKASKGQLVEQERRIRELEKKLSDANRKLYDRQMLKLGNDEFSVKHISSTQTMQEAMILLRRGIVVKAQCPVHLLARVPVL